jgi:hypothetical protein
MRKKGEEAKPRYRVLLLGSGVTARKSIESCWRSGEFVF